jgi:hypothetical protein
LSPRESLVTSCFRTENSENRTETYGQIDLLTVPVLRETTHKIVFFEKVFGFTFG